MTKQDTKAIVPRKEWFSLQSPIGIIGGFAALVEVALILASIFVSGNARWALIGFAAVAFFYVATWFFWILIHKNWVLYPPKEYGGETGVTTYVEAMSYRVTEKQSDQLAATLDSETIQQIYATSVTTTHPTYPESHLTEEGDVGAQSGFLVFVGPRRPDSLGLHVDYEAFHSVTDCLRYIGNTLLPDFESGEKTEKRRRHDMNYGTSWILKESRTQRALKEIGPRWALKQSGNLSDLRRLRDTDFQPGMHLELERLREDSFSISDLLADEEKLLRSENDK